MVDKNRTHAPHCEGRFGQLRGLFYQAAQQYRELNLDRLARIASSDDLESLVYLAFSIGKEVPFELYDTSGRIRDPYLKSDFDILRGDPLIGRADDDNTLRLSMLPFVYEAMRETLVEDIESSRNFITAFKELGEGRYSSLLPGLLGFEEGEVRDVDLDTLNEMLIDAAIDFTFSKESYMKELHRVAATDFTDVEKSIDYELLRAYARLYISEGNKALVENLHTFHKGVSQLHDALGLERSCFFFEIGNGRRGPTLEKYVLEMEFGPGLNTRRSLVSSAPYRIILYQNGDNEYVKRPIFGISFFVRQEDGLDTMVLSQVQEIRGGKLPNNVELGECALSLAAQIAQQLGFEQVTVYSGNDHRSKGGRYVNPIRIHYPDKADLGPLLQKYQDQAAIALGWAPIFMNDKGRDFVVGYRHII